MTSRLHLIWDWNGTVLNDFDVAFLSTNRSFRDAGLPQITTATYRELLQTPIRGFYTAVVGRDLSDEECDSIETAFRTYYPLYEKEAVLSSGLPDLFRQWHDAGLWHLARWRDLATPGARPPLALRLSPVRPAPQGCLILRAG
jgi:phosphoglycolate phosphatase-like HAD superfamily hydrolase